MGSVQKSPGHECLWLAIKPTLGGLGPAEGGQHMGTCVCECLQGEVCKPEYSSTRGGCVSPPVLGLSAVSVSGRYPVTCVISPCDLPSPTLRPTIIQ